MITWKSRPGLRVAHAVTPDGRTVCGEVVASLRAQWQPSTRPHCRMCTRRLPKPLTWTQLGDRPWPNCGTCAGWLIQPFMAEAISSVSIEHPVNVKRLVESYHEGGHRE